MKIKLWTGKTARQELVQGIVLSASVKGFTINDSLEHALDGAEKCPDSSMKREMLRYWESSSSAAQARLLQECRREIKSLDILYGRQVAR